MIRALKLEEDDGGAEDEEARARVRAAEAALERLEELGPRRGCRRHRRAAPGLYRFRIDRFSERLDEDGDGKIEHRSTKFRKLRRELLEAERHAVVAMRNTGEISDEVMRRIERDLDLEDSRLGA